MTLQGVYGLTVSNGGLCSIATGMVFGACSLSQITAVNGQVSIQSSYSITGSAQAHWNCNVGGLVTNNSTSACTITLSPSINYSVGFAEVAAGNITTYSSAGNLIFNITGSMSGTSPRYSCLLGGSIDTGGSGVSFLPGTTAGNTGTGTNMGFYA
jgi:hypothetical protein